MHARLFVWLIPLLLAVAPAHAGLFNPETFKLANGLEVVVIPDHRAPVVTHMVWYKVGAADEPPGKSGIAHFLEHLMFKGTKTIPPGEFSKIVARQGGRDNAFTAQDYTGYFQTVARDRLELVMRMEADRMTNLELTDEVVSPERHVVLEERSSVTENNPRALLGEQMSAAQFLNHPYGEPIIGWEHEIRDLTLNDAIKFYGEHYAPNNAILIVAGDITAAELKPLAERYYGAIAARPIPPRVRPQEPPQRAPRRITFEDARVQQPSWTRTYLAPSRTAGETLHAVPLSVLADILGGGPTSRMQRELVLNNGVAAGAGAWYDDISLDPSRFGLTVTPRPGGDLDAIEAAVDKLIAELLRDGVTEAELERAKTGMLANAVYARDSLYIATRTFGSALTAGMTVEDVEAWPDLVKAVTVQQVNDAARYLFDIRRSVTGLLLPRPAS